MTGQMPGQMTFWQLVHGGLDLVNFGIWKLSKKFIYNAACY